MTRRTLLSAIPVAPLLLGADDGFKFDQSTRMRDANIARHRDTGRFDRSRRLYDGTDGPERG